MSKATVHEMLQFNELIRAQSTEVQKMQAMAPMVADPDLRQEIEACISADSAQVKALVDYAKTTCQMAH
jgi:hypothetical protein